LEEALVVQGRSVRENDLHDLRQLMAAHPGWSRRRLSQQLCVRWKWRNAAGRLKDMAARSLLVKLEQRGLISLPARRQTPTNRMRLAVVAPRHWDRTPRSSSLEELGTLEVREVSAEPASRAELREALAQFHYLGSGGTVGENLQYVVLDQRGQMLAGLQFGSAAWKCRDRDRFIGWEAAQREANLWRMTNNSRFLILPWVRVAHLGSWILGQALRRVSTDWEGKYGHGVVLVETFVERDRFRGTVYQAANWQRVGATRGRTRQDRYTRLCVPVKEIYVYPLARNFREVLCHGPA
jgi:Domain of unknown function (DUF4338)